ncbi:MAG: hypothetical protein DRI61_04200 [Chloroflexi bacterium]|nr:MAG: hypothetical protein DRI61_04200 [Chloroflexota bacterium]
MEINIDFALVEGLVKEFNLSPSELLRAALTDFYLRKSIAAHLKPLLHRMYAEGLISREELLIYVPSEDAMDIILGDEVGKKGAKIADEIWKTALGA